jgi:hypothetical protein
VRSVAAYVRQRLPAHVFVPAIVLHATAAWSATDRVWTVFGLAVGLMTLLFVSFRLWDDLEDADHDCVVHPERLLPRGSRQPFRAVAAGLGLITAVCVSPGAEVLAGVGVLYGAAWAGYRVVRPRVTDVVWRYGFLLLKYPGFVWLVATAIGRPEPARLAAASVAAYLAACLYEAWHHDMRSRLGVVS